ncbi:MAG: deoxyribose-phosphate aldolase [Anaeromyxobacter sp.]
MALLDPARLRTPRDLAPFIDHTLLAPGAGAAEVARLLDEALAHRFATVCVRGEWVPEARRRLAGSGVKAIAVADFPLGEASPEARAAEAAALARAGAEEVDVVVRLPDLLAGRHEAVLRDLRAVVAAAGVPVKVILETAHLTRDQLAAGAALARCAGAAYVKTSTGFGRGGATREAVALLREVVGPALGVKASGGIRTAADALAMIAAGADRVGASASVAIVSAASF